LFLWFHLKPNPEANPCADERQQVVGIEAPLRLLRRLQQLERHRPSRGTRANPLGDTRAELDRGERATGTTAAMAI
jgi:hypothetical protein